MGLLRGYLLISKGFRVLTRSLKGLSHPAVGTLGVGQILVGRVGLNAVAKGLDVRAVLDGCGC